MFDNVLQVVVTEALMLFSGIVGWFMHSMFITNAVNKAKAEVEALKAKINVPAQ